jgi:hypothetical protein
MYLNERLEDRPLGSKIRTPSRAPRSSEYQPVVQLASIEAFGAQIQRRVANCGSAGRRPAVMLLAAGEPGGGVTRGEFLAALGARLCSRLRSTDMVVQIGEQFGLYLQGDVAAHAIAIRERLKLALQQDFGFGDVTVQIRPRFGLAIHPGVPISGIDLVIAAASALEQ